MAQVMLLDSKLQLVFETGMNESGEVEFSQRTYSNILPEATAEGFLQVSQAIESLTLYSVVSVYRNDRSDIVA